MRRASTKRPTSTCRRSMSHRLMPPSLRCAAASADIIVTDWLWVSRERSLGANFVFYPYSSAIGAVVVNPARGIRDVRDLPGRKLAVAGGPLDKSWLLLQAWARRSGLDLRRSADVVYGAPPLLAEKAAQGEVDAALEYWNFCADLEARGFTRLIDMAEVEKALGARGPVAAIGYVFDASFAAAHRDALQRFFVTTRRAKQLIATNADAWQIVAKQLPSKNTGNTRCLSPLLRGRNPRAADRRGRSRRPSTLQSSGGDRRKRTRRQRRCARSRHILQGRSVIAYFRGMRIASVR